MLHGQVSGKKDTKESLLFKEKFHCGWYVLIFHALVEINYLICTPPYEGIYDIHVWLEYSSKK
jgi:hypothetical protein